MKTVALIAHDKKKEEMIDFVSQNKAVFAPHKLVATATTGKLLKNQLALEVVTMMSGPLGGDQQIGAMIATDQVDLVVFLRDPLTSQPHEPDINALLRICDVHNIPLATNRRSAQILIKLLDE